MSNFEGVRFTSCASNKLFVRTYYDKKEFRSVKYSLLPACFSRASANLWPGSGFARIGCSPDETCGEAMKCDKTYSYNLIYEVEHRISNTECRRSASYLLRIN